jgi:hypothetical protein
MALVHLNYQHANNDSKGFQISISLSVSEKAITSMNVVWYHATILNSFHITLDNFMAIKCDKIG